MTTIPQVAQVLQTVLGATAEQAGRESGFVQRESKLSGSKFVQTLVFGWMAAPEATLEQLAQTAAALGVEVSSQGLEQRFSQAAADCVRRVLEAAVQEATAGAAVDVSLLRRFAGVFLLDSSTISLPDALAEVWAGCGSREGSRSALKLQVALDLTTGALRGPLLQAGRVHDRRSEWQQSSWPPGSLRIADLGYFSLEVFQRLAAEGAYYLSRLQVQTAVLDLAGRTYNLLALLQAQDSPVDRPILLGAHHALPARLLAARAPLEVAAERRRRLHAEARRRGQDVSQARLRLADWDILITNAPSQLLTLPEALCLAHARWQVELLFKLWKSQGRLDESRSAKPWRILCEVYAKMLALLIQHWMLIVSCWGRAERSLVKAIQTTQRYAAYVAASFHDAASLCTALATIQRCLSLGCKINKSRVSRRTYQQLLAFEEGLA
mgnify:FL=1